MPKSKRKHTPFILVMLQVCLTVCVSCRAPLGQQRSEAPQDSENLASHQVLKENRLETPWQNVSKPEFEAPGWGQSCDLAERHRPQFSPELLENFRDLSIYEAIQVAFANGEVLRSLGGAVVAQPESA